MRLRTRTVTIINTERVVDGDGNPVFDDYGNETFQQVPVTSEGWNVQPQSSSENVDARQQVTAALRAYGPLDAPIRATSKVIPYGDGVRYEVSGDVERWEPSRPGRPGHIEVSLEKVTG